MICRLTRGYNGTYRLDHPDGRSAYFEPGRRTLTGAKHRNGEFRAMTAPMVRAYLLGPDAAHLCAEPYAVADVDDKGIFDPLTPVDISMHARFVYHLVDTSPRVLLGACALESRKAPKERD